MRALRWCFILLQVVWLNVVLPGHTRGVVTLPGTSVARETASPHACCGGAARPKTNDPSSPTPRERAHCAVCFFAAHMAPPAPVVCELLPHGLVEQLAPRPSPAVVSVERPTIYLGRGPPNA
jgi:hypothetical protein